MRSPVSGSSNFRTLLRAASRTIAIARRAERRPTLFCILAGISFSLLMMLSAPVSLKVKSNILAKLPVVEPPDIAQPPTADGLAHLIPSQRRIPTIYVCGAGDIARANVHRQRQLMYVIHAGLEFKTDQILHLFSGNEHAGLGRSLQFDSDVL